MRRADFVRFRRPRRAKGAALVEFALVAILFIPLLITVTDLGRWLFTSNAVSEATRLGARLAVVCSPEDWDDVVLRRMQAIVPELQASNVDFELFPSNSCVKVATLPGDEVCSGVSVTINDFSIESLSPVFQVFFEDGRMPVFPFKVSLPRESLSSSWTEPSGGPSTNNACN